MKYEAVTPLLLTYNEAANLDRTLQKLTWAKEIIVIDSYSEDSTLAILKSYSQIKILQRKFDTHAQQWNYGLEQIKSEWVLSLDADYTMTDELINKFSTLEDSTINGYSIPFKYCVFGKPLKGTILPPRLALFRKDSATYIDDGHTQLLQLNGRSGRIDAFIYHDDRKPVVRWFNSEIKYADLEMKKLLQTPTEELSFVDRIRLKKVIAPVLVLVYCLVYKGMIFDGMRGIYYTFQRVLAELLLAIKLIENDFRNMSQH